MDKIYYKMYVTPTEAQKHFGVSNKTLQRWANDGKIKSIRTDGNHRRYKIDLENAKKKIIYARVSSKKQKDDLDRQIQFMQEKYKGYTVVKDIGSGINFKRKGFNHILDQLFEGNIKEVAVSSKDRFSRFGFKFFEDLFKRFGAKLVHSDNDKFKSFEQEMSEDILAIITVFTAKYHGKRKYKFLSEG